MVFLKKDSKYNELLKKYKVIIVSIYVHLFIHLKKHICWFKLFAANKQRFIFSKDWSVEYKLLHQN